jgi:hypothetical protein
MQADLRRWLDIVTEAVGHDRETLPCAIRETDDDDDMKPLTGWGWWILPDGAVGDIEEEGGHGVVAYNWLRQVLDDYDNEDYDQAIADMLTVGGIRIATFHGTDHMNIDFEPGKVTRRALTSLRRLMKDTRGTFHGYYFGGVGDGPFTYAEAMRRLV